MYVHTVVAFGQWCSRWARPEGDRAPSNTVLFEESAMEEVAQSEAERDTGFWRQTCAVVCASCLFVCRSWGGDGWRQSKEGVLESGGCDFSSKGDFQAENYHAMLLAATV